MYDRDQKDCMLHLLPSEGSSTPHTTSVTTCILPGLLMPENLQKLLILLSEFADDDVLRITEVQGLIQLLRDQYAIKALRITGAAHCLMLAFLLMTTLARKNIIASASRAPIVAGLGATGFITLLFEAAKGMRNPKYDYATPLCGCGTVLTIFIVFFAGGSIMPEEDSELALEILECAAVLLLWFRTLHFLAPAKAFGNILRTLFESIKDIRSFSLVMGLLWLTLMHALLASRPNPEADIRGQAVDLLFEVYRLTALGDFDYADYKTSWEHQVVFGIGSFLGLIVMLNLLISVISDTFDRVQEKSATTYYRESASLILEYWNLPLGPRHQQEARTHVTERFLPFQLPAERRGLSSGRPMGG
eukprot:gnl/TRDRNA2_/TRDRNA2_177513_c0_seq1.p1 gnl/TRDRNA2_/TRDRNA2_177513_c0~~gnl/TRDRNA2_/TRDRNA2_177513_c0_seq1.p1  ORF type:complete len:370 (-),score=56.37 gnl/TRDRNA2_/TRDRNA2_177513_c0_seq1:95-1177(-)